VAGLALSISRRCDHANPSASRLLDMESEK
jgi:hypothetical protein